MPAGDYKQKQLVDLLRSLDYQKLDLSYITREIAPGKYEEGYDRFGKYKVRFGNGAATVLTTFLAIFTYLAFWPREARDYLDPVNVWLRANIFWIAPGILISAYLIWRSNRKVEREQSQALTDSIEASGLELVTDPDYSISCEKYPELLFTLDGTFRLKTDNGFKVIFGTTKAWWDPLAEPDSPIGTLFIYVGINSLSAKNVFASPFQEPNWDELPPMTDKAKAAVAKLASKYLVRLGEGGLLIGYAKDAINPVTSSLEANTNSKLSWQILYTLMANEVVDIVEGLS